MTTSTSTPSGDVTVDQDLTEHLMRVTDDDTLVLRFFTTEPGTRDAYAALGVLLSSHTAAEVGLYNGTPLVAHVSGSAQTEPGWRDKIPAGTVSLWSNLQFLTTVYGAPTATDHYQALEELRQREDQDLNG
jgi:hypothetical protein